VTLSPSSSSSSRFYFIDLLRGWAVFVMIETHVVNAVLRSDIKDQTFFKILTFLNGLVAPSFLFCAGFALAITLQRKWNDYVMFRKPLWKYTFRLIFILIVGYSLHLPFFSLTRLLQLTDEKLWISFFQVDILQTIASTLLLLVFLAILTRRHAIFISTSSIIAVIIIFISPIIRSMDHSSLPIWFRSYLSPQFKSQFPLFPWSAFLISGTILGYGFLKLKERGKERKFINTITLFAVVGILLSLIAEIIPITIYANHDFWRASPEFFFVRLGLVVLGLAGLWWYEQKRKISSQSIFTLFGMESLLVYVVHLLVVYGYTYEWSFIRYFGPTLNYLGCFGLFIGLCVAMYIIAFIWHRLKEWNIRIAKVVQFAVLAGIVLTFIFKTT